MSAPIAGRGRRSLRLAVLRLAGKLVIRGPMPAPGQDVNVLLVRPDHLGDALLTLPALRLVRRSLPRASITLLVGPWAQDVYSRTQDVDEVLKWEFPGFSGRPKANLLAPYLSLWSLARRLRRREFNASAILREDHWWGAMACAVAGIPIRVGSDHPECRPFLSHSLSGRPGLHRAEAALGVAEVLAQALGQEPNWEPEPAIHFQPSPTEHHSAVDLLRKAGVDPEGSVMALHPGTRSGPKLWPTRNWALLADGLMAEFGARIVVSGTREEAPVVREIVAQGRAPLANLAGASSWGQLAALFSLCRLVVGVDSGPLHLAGAVGTPTVRLFGPTDIALYGPWPTSATQRAVRIHLPCSPCGNLVNPPCGQFPTPCMLGVRLEAVLEACRAAMAAASEGDLPNPGPARPAVGRPEGEPP